MWIDPLFTGFEACCEFIKNAKLLIDNENLLSLMTKSRMLYLHLKTQKLIL